MKRSLLRPCLETGWQPIARSLVPLSALSHIIVATNLGLTTNQTRRLHHQGPLAQQQTISSRQISQPLTHSRPQPTFPLLATSNHNSRRKYTTLTPTPPEPTIHSLFDPQTSTWQYLVADPTTHTAAIIDPVLDYNPTTRTVSTTTADTLLSLVHQHGYTISHILETHAHADHLTAAFYLQRRLGRGADGVAAAPPPPVGIGQRIGQVQSLFGKRYGVDSSEYDGVFDLLWEDDAVFWVGGLKGWVLHLPGHTPDHVGYWIGGES